MNDTHAVIGKGRATLIGAAAILMWALLAVLTAASGRVPPLALNALCFGAAGLGATAFLLARGRGLTPFRQPLRAWLLGVGGLFGYHALYFTALKTAPPVAANLLNYLWPLLIVLLSGLLPGERLRLHHVAGAVLGLAGAAVIVLGSGSLSNVAVGTAPLGYLAALGAAVVWAGYSVLSRRLAHIPTEAMAGFCLATSALSLIGHLLFEPDIWPATAAQWAGVAAMAALPLGAAFFVWDHGVKRGDIQVLGAAAYATPLLSTALLIAAGYGQLRWSVALACALITAGALLAGKDLLLSRRSAGSAPVTSP